MAAPHPRAAFEERLRLARAMLRVGQAASAEKGVGVHPSESERWLVELYCTNLTDKNAIVYSNTGNFDLRETTNEPRVFGVRLSYRFNDVGSESDE